VVRSADGSTQIFATEDEADKLTEKLVRERIRFSIYPISLEDIFYYLVRKPIEEDTKHNPSSAEQNGLHEDQ
jgi:hypothetical protein